MAATKLFAVPEDVLTSIKTATDASVTPEQRVEARIEREMQALWTDSSLSEADRLARYNELLQRLLQLHAATRNQQGLFAARVGRADGIAPAA